MADDRTLALYRLALAQVPDPDAAGDIFMDARNEADLLRRAAHWRVAQGLPPLAAADVELPMLDADAVEHALHLARRGRRRRKMMLTGAVAACVVALVAVVAGGAALARSLRTVPGFEGQPVAVSEPVGGLRLSLYRQEAVPGKVTVWWELRGAGARKAAQSRKVSLLFPGGALTEASVTEPVLSESNRYAARSEFPLFLSYKSDGTLAAGGVRLDVSVGNESTEIPLNVRQQLGRFDVTFTSITFAKAGTTLRYLAEGPFGTHPLAPEALVYGANAVKPVSIAKERGAFRAVLDPVPSPFPATAVTVMFQPLIQELGTVALKPPGGEAAFPMTWLGDRAYYLWSPAPDETLLPLPGEPYFADEAGRHYPIDMQPPQMRGGVIQYSLVVMNPPEGVRFVALSMPGMGRVHTLPPVKLELLHPGE